MSNDGKTNLSKDIELQILLGAIVMHIIWETQDDMSPIVDEILRQETDSALLERLRSSLLKCLEVNNEREALLVRTGLVAGSLNSMIGHDFILQFNLHRARKTHASELAKRNKKIADKYRMLQPAIGCLNARRQIREEFRRNDSNKYSAVHIKNILKAEGIVIKRKF
jgi:hypothetical protein